MGLPIGHEHRLAYVACDEKLGAHQATAHLAGLGRRRIATVTGPLDTPGGRDRPAGYREALESAGLEQDPGLVAHGDYTRASGLAAMQSLLELAEDELHDQRSRGPDAVFVASDLMALGVLDALDRAGLRVPQDVAVVGFDDSPAARVARPELTTIRQPWPRISHEMVRLLLALLDGQAPTAVVLPTELVRRESA